jgi:hypothetical protein
VEAKIIQEFKGILNNVLIENEKLYYCIEYILSKIEDKFGECFNKKFVEDLKITLNKLYYKNEYFYFEDFEREIDFDVDSFKRLVFRYNYETYGFESLNEEIFNGKYDINESYS